MGNLSGSSLFGVKTSRLCPFVVLDKSFLQGVSRAQLLLYARQGWTFGVTEVLIHEQLRKRDDCRITNFFKLHSIERSLRFLPGIGEMMRAETKLLKPASTILSAKVMQFTLVQGPSGELFELDEPSQRSLNQREAEYRERCEDMIAVWRDFDQIPELKNTRGTTRMPEEVTAFENKIRDDHDDIRGVHRRHRHPTFPAPELLDENWTFFRWWQVQLLGGLTYYSSYGVNIDPQREKLLHELFDLTYVLYGALVGGLASRDKQPIRRFKLLRPDGVVLR